MLKTGDLMGPTQEMGAARWSDMEVEGEF